MLAMQRVSDSAKLGLILPLVEDLLGTRLQAADPTRSQALTTEDDSEAGLRRRVLFEVFDAEAADALNLEGSRAWEVLLQALDESGSSGTLRTPSCIFTKYLNLF